MLPSLRNRPGDSGSSAQLQLHPHQLRALCRNPAAQIIWQRGVAPIAARTQDFDFAPSRKCQNAIGIISRRQTRIDIFSRNNRERKSMTSVFDSPKRIERTSAKKKRGNHHYGFAGGAAKRERRQCKGANPETYTLLAKHKMPAKLMMREKRSTGVFAGSPRASLDRARTADSPSLRHDAVSGGVSTRS